MLSLFILLYSHFFGTTQKRNPKNVAGWINCFHCLRIRSKYFVPRVGLTQKGMEKSQGHVFSFLKAMIPFQLFSHYSLSVLFCSEFLAKKGRKKVISLVSDLFKKK